MKALAKKLTPAIDRRRLVAAFLLAAALGGVTLYVRLYGGEQWRWLVEHERLVRKWLTVERPLQGWFVGLGVFTLLSLVPGLAGKSLVVAWLYGFWPALPLVNLGLTAAALVEFALARWLLRQWVEDHYGGYLERVRPAVDREGGFFLFAARIAHAPFTLTNFVMGATPLRAKSFWWATQLGLLPGNVVFCYAGSTLPTLEDLAQGDFGAVFSVGVWTALVLLAIFPWLARWSFRYVVRRWKRA